MCREYKRAQTVINIDLKIGQARCFDRESTSLQHTDVSQQDTQSDVSPQHTDESEPEAKCKHKGTQTDQKRQVDLLWPDYHMAMAFLASLSCYDELVKTRTDIEVSALHYGSVILSYTTMFIYIYISL